jgi:hypothetical protein
MTWQDSTFTVPTTATISNAYDGWLALLEKYHKNDIDSLMVDILNLTSQIVNLSLTRKIQHYGLVLT